MPTALIVDDEVNANDLLARIVKLRGYTTRSEFTGETAIEAVESQPFDVVFLDLMLPDIDGYEVCRRIKASPETRTTPVVMVSAALADDNRARGIQAGADGYIPKPYTPNQIFDALESADAMRRAWEEDGE